MGSKENTWNIRLLWKVLFPSVKMSIVYCLTVYVHYLLQLNILTEELPKKKKSLSLEWWFFFFPVIYFLIHVFLQK